MEAISRYRFVPPASRPNFISRAIASDLLGSPYPVNFLVSPTGFGKSTLMSQSYRLARARGQATRWLNLYYHALGTEGLIRYLALTLRQRSTDEAVVASERERYGIDDLLSALDAVCPRDGTLTVYLDEIAADDADDAIELTRIIGKHFGDTVRLVLSARSTPFGLPRVLDDGSAVFTSNDLAFTSAELRRLFNDSLSERDIASLVAITGGWPILVTSIRNRTARSAPLLSDLTDGCDEVLVDFVRDQMGLAPSSHDIDVLAAAFAFGQASGPIFDHKDFAGAGEIVSRLARDGLVKVQIDGPHLIYEPHAAIRFAMDRLGRRSSPKRLLDIHRFMANSLLEGGDGLGAIQHALETGDHIWLSELIEAGGGWLLILQWGEPIMQAVLRIPLDRLKTRPAALLARVFAIVHLEDVHSARALLDEAATMFDASNCGGETAFRRFRIGVAAIDALLRSYEMKPIDFDLLERMREDCPPELRGPLDALVMNLKGGYQLREGNVVGAQEIGREAALLCRTANTVYVETYVQLWLGYAYLQSGDTRDASHCFQRVLDIFETRFGTQPNQLVAAKVFLADLEFERGDTDKAYAMIDALAEDVERIDPWYEMLKPFYRITTYRVLQRDGLEAAVDFVDATMVRIMDRRMAQLSAYLRTLRKEIRRHDEFGDFKPVEGRLLDLRVHGRQDDAPANETDRTAFPTHPGRERERRHIADGRTGYERALPEIALLAAKSRAGARPHLSPREREVLAFIAEGLSSKEIAWRLSLSIGTVLGYRKNLYRKIGVNNRSAAISFARNFASMARPADDHSARGHLTAE